MLEGASYLRQLESRVYALEELLQAQERTVVEQSLRLEEALQMAVAESKARALLAALVESSGEAIISTALDKKITSWNHHAEKMFDFAQAEAIGESFLTIVPPEGRLLAMQMLQEIQDNFDRVLNYEGLAVRRNGTLIEISMTL